MLRVLVLCTVEPARKIDFVYDRNDVQKRNHSSAAWTTTYVAMPTTAMRDTAPAKWPAAGFTSEHSGARFHVRTEPDAVYRRFVREAYNLSESTVRGEHQRCLLHKEYPPRQPIAVGTSQ